VVVYKTHIGDKHGRDQSYLVPWSPPCCVWVDMPF